MEVISNCANKQRAVVKHDARISFRRGSIQVREMEAKWWILARLLIAIEMMMMVQMMIIYVLAVDPTDDVDDLCIRISNHTRTALQSR